MPSLEEKQNPKAYHSCSKRLKQEIVEQGIEQNNQISARHAYKAATAARAAAATKSFWTPVGAAALSAALVVVVLSLVVVVSSVVDLSVVVGEELLVLEEAPAEVVLVAFSASEIRELESATC